MKTETLVQSNLFSAPEPTAASRAERVQHDYYPTPEKITRELVKALPEIKGTIIGEPCSGQGAISRVLSEFGCTAKCSDIQWDDDKNRDATTADFWESTFTHNIDWMVTNPPFCAAEKILPLAWKYSNVGCAFLLRLTYLEPTKGRAQWLQAHADNLRMIIPVSPRPRFRRDTSGADSVTTAWFVWDKTWSWERLGVQSPFSFCAGWRDS
jgi:hypothetical protein